MVLSTFSNNSLEDVQRAAPEGLRWFQLHVFRDREFTRNLVERAERAGYRALVLTVGMPVCSQRATGTNPTFCVPDNVRYANLEGTSMDQGADPKVDFHDRLFDPSLTWRDVTWLKSLTKLPVVAKGICTAEDAEEAVHHGVSAILVSNHGGRRLDGIPSTIEVLPEIVRAVRGRVEVYLDGGVRRGTDVIKALGLGAKAVFVGRPALWGLAYNKRRQFRRCGFCNSTHQPKKCPAWDKTCGICRKKIMSPPVVGKRKQFKRWSTKVQETRKSQKMTFEF
ncbi:hypothetical protein HPB47_017015 [Ixodes persulcatus]|uniref:Uncharacterized protein n=1 Tax=Ixodes persulcatus TaxID=34615 RepID=A0AC60QPD9_IXOPE|nr:hypothetical protein HPB47_017015 [Ixodes persulcatus]